MPALERHLKISIERTGKEYREIHEWLDSDPEKKAERHDITKIYEYGKMIKEEYGEEALQEYIRHIQDDIKTKLEQIQHNLEKDIINALAYFGIK